MCIARDALVIQHVRQVVARLVANLATTEGLYAVEFIARSLIFVECEPQVEWIPTLAVDAGEQVQHLLIRGDGEAMHDDQVVGQHDLKHQLLSVPSTDLYAMFAFEGPLQLIFDAADQGRLSTAFDSNLVSSLHNFDGVLSADIFSEPGEIDDVRSARARSWQINVSDRDRRRRWNSRGTGGRLLSSR